jgi:hypothetical protein
MKKIFLLLTVFSMVFASCDPMEDIYEDLDAVETPIVGDTVYTLTDDDYDELELNYGNFGSEEEAKLKIPTLLSNKYPVWGKGSSALVTFNLYQKINTYSENVYELSDADHNEITGKTYGNFDKSYHITNYVEAKYPSPEEGDFVSLRYRFYSGGEVTLTDGFAYTNGDWEKITGYTPDEYTAMGERYPNFSSHDEAASKMAITLLETYKFNPKSEGDIVTAMYELYKGSGVTKSYTNNFIFDGTAFSEYNNVIDETIQFGHDGSTWVPDNTIKYTMVAADYTLVATTLAAESGYESAASNLGQYGNFNRTGSADGNEASGSSNWNDLMMVRALGIVLDSVAPSAEEGQKYVVSFNYYDGSGGQGQFNLIQTGK